MLNQITIENYTTDVVTPLYCSRELLMLLLLYIAGNEQIMYLPQPNKYLVPATTGTFYWIPVKHLHAPGAGQQVIPALHK